MIAYLLNLFDLACTYLFLERGGYELNPVARWLIGIHPAAFPFAKVFVAGVLCSLLHIIGKVEAKTQFALRAVTGYYAAIAVYYIILIFGGAVYG